MADTEALNFLRSMATQTWPHDRASGETMLAALGLTSTGPVDDHDDDEFTLFGLSGSVDAASNFTFTTHENTFVMICFFMGSSRRPKDPNTRRIFDELSISMSEEFGAAKRVWDDQETPLRWQAGDLDIEVQLFDRRDSQIMVSIEHRARAHSMEQAALATRRTHDHPEP